MKIITLLTDFGLKDTYVGIMKGVILSIDPHAVIIDITHEVEPQDFREGAFLIEESCRWFPDGTIHVAVVDPTVGSSRRPMILSARNQLFVGPDNGIFTLVMEETSAAHAIDNAEFMLPSISGTFHGRDIFSPAAAHLSMGVSLKAFGRRINDPVRLDGLFPEVVGDELKGKVVRFDRFGNAITNIPEEMFHSFLKGAAFRVDIGEISFAGLSKSYYEADLTCLFGSSGYLEFGYFKGSFRDRTGTGKDAGVRVIPSR